MQFTSIMYNEALILIENLCLTIANKTFAQLGLTAPNRSVMDIWESDLQRESQYNIQELKGFLLTNLPKLVEEQRVVYNTIISAIDNKIAKIRSRNKFVLAIASSGIAATLLDGGRTAHSALKLPLNLHVTETPTCNITKNSGMGKILQTCQLIIWYECTMAHKKALEALDRTLQDLREKSSPFGGALILLSGDFRQTLPVIPRSTPADELDACLKSSN
uniref:ATP-dependent DNA helicase n=1 Tax=Trichogramma kaykai TaxID=54128 RepID=A0ABD2WQ69_9HYME